MLLLPDQYISWLLFQLLVKAGQVNLFPIEILHYYLQYLVFMKRNDEV